MTGQGSSAVGSPARSGSATFAAEVALREMGNPWLLPGLDYVILLAELQPAKERSRLSAAQAALLKQLGAVLGGNVEGDVRIRPASPAEPATRRARIWTVEAQLRAPSQPVMRAEARSRKCT